MRFHCLVIALALLAAFASDSWGQSQESPRQDSQAAKQQPKEENQPPAQPSASVKDSTTEQTERKSERDYHERIEKRFDGWSLSDKIAGIATVVAFLQFAALFLTLRIMRRTAQRQLRAYICDIEGNAVFPGGTFINIDIVFRNSGQTPAYDVEIRCDPPILGRIDARPFDQAFRFAPVRTIIAPDSKFVMRRILIIDNDASAIQQIQNGVKSIFVWGRVDYVDAFKKPRHFIFRCIALGPGSSWPLLPHPDGYEAD